jgi:predicted alpha/beta-fold hydrolase
MAWEEVPPQVLELLSGVHSSYSLFLFSLLSEYIVHLAERLHSSSFQVVALVARGCGGLPITTPTFVPRKTSDLREIITYLHNKTATTNTNNKRGSQKEQRKHRKIFFVGFSLGAALGLKYLHEEGTNTPLMGAVAISPPWDMSQHTIVYPLWSRLILTLLKRYLSRHPATLLNSGVTLQQVHSATSLSDLDQLLLTSYGYTSLEAYYHDNSATHYTTGIEIPTLVISAEDDPICCSSSPSVTMTTTTTSHSPYPTVGNGQLGRGICFVKTATGGHCAFPQGVLPLKESWVDDVIVDWITVLPTLARDGKGEGGSSTS